MSTLINLHGGPGAGKSTTAAFMFYLLKDRGVNCELVREYVKKWAWDERKIGKYDQIYFLGKQIHEETILLGKVDFIITDSPVWLNVMYSQKYSPYIHESILYSVRDYYDELIRDEHKVVNIVLKRSKPYNPKGRYQTENQAKELDVDCLAVLEQSKVNYHIYETTRDSIATLVDRLVLGEIAG
jgi:hypothetical protein